MSYAAIDDLVSRFGESEIIQLTDREVSGALDDAVAQQALDDASAEIDGYLQSRYTLPLATVPAALARVCADIARYRLYDDHASEQIRDRYRDAIRWLEGVSRGNVSLGLADDGSAPTSGGTANVVADGRAFARSDRW